MTELIKRAHRFIVTLRFSIITIFVIFFVATILTLMSLAYWRSLNTIVFTASSLMQHISTKILNEINNELLDAETETEFVSQMLQKNVLQIEDKKLMVPYLYELIKRYPIIQTAFWGDENGDFFIVEKEEGHLMLRIINHYKEPQNTTVIFAKEYEKDLLQRIDSKDLSYDPRNRDWYKEAKKTGKIIWTDIYPYKSNNLLGITVAAPVYNPENKLLGVFAFDIRLDYLSKFLKKVNPSRHGFVFLITSKGGVIAFPKLKNFKISGDLMDIHTVKIPWVVESYEIYKRSHKQEFTFDYNGKTYLANYNHIPHFKEVDWIVGTVVPEDDFTYELRKATLLDILLGLLILAVGIAIVSGLITRVVKPIRKVVHQIDKIKHFNLEEDKPIFSRIKEVILLSDAVQALRSGLRSFQKYVPATLVRQLIEAGESALVGGSKKKLTIFFSDIEQFTTLSETMDPNVLMEYICEYFEEISKIIIDEKGTIDKYIGDSVMAFWGAPIQVEVPAYHAALAALRCQRRLKILNKKWQEEGKPPLYTRIGLHRGDAIVGNVGSTERLNYTALGDAINVASRLEGINKIYHTHIIASDAVYQVIKNKLILRKVDRVTVKGKLQSSDIYELLAENKSELTFDLDAYRNEFDKGFSAYQKANWDEALTAFEACLQIYPEDTLAPVFIKRCQDFKLNPPEKWDGVWRM